jgi:hypothetical protein
MIAFLVVVLLAGSIWSLSRHGMPTEGSRNWSFTTESKRSGQRRSYSPADSGRALAYLIAFALVGATGWALGDIARLLWQ